MKKVRIVGVGLTISQQGFTQVKIFVMNLKRNTSLLIPLLLCWRHERGNFYAPDWLGRELFR